MARRNECNLWITYLNMALLSFRILFALLVYTISSPFLRSNAYTAKPLKRRLYDRVVQEISRLSILETESMFRSSGLDNYRQWIKHCSPKFDAVVDELDVGLGESKGGIAANTDFQLLWIGPKRTDKIILYFPGGAYIFPVSEMIFKFWRYAQLEWEKQGLEVGIAVLSYTVHSGTDAAFPIQLLQATCALKHLFSIGCSPSDIQLVGDSAGGNLITQLLLHMMHPLPANLVPPLELHTGLRGVYIMSPWVSLSNPEQWGSSIRTNDQDSILYDTGPDSWGSIYLNKIFKGHIHNESNISHSEFLLYADPILAPDDWFSSLPKIVDRILVSAGKEERFFNQVEVFYEKKIKPHFMDVNAMLMLQDGGVHDDPMSDFAVSDKPLGNTLTGDVLDWIAEGFKVTEKKIK